MTNVSAHPYTAIPSLDGLRAISVLVVLVGHSGYGAVVPGGLGVTIFFFLSGYLITTLLLSEYERRGTINVAAFYARRMLRLFPPLAITLAIAYVLVLVGLLSGGITVAGLLSQLLYFANYYSIFFDPGETLPSGTWVIWSLAIEEHFYILYPILLLTLLNARLSVRQMGSLLGTVCVAILVWRIYLVQFTGAPEIRTYYGSDTRIDSIIFGCLLSVLCNPVRDAGHDDRMSATQWLLLGSAGLLLLFTLLYRNPVFRETYRYSLQGLALMPIFYCAIRFHNHRIFKILNIGVVQKIGIYSYAIYLIHFVVIKVLTENLPWLSANPWLVTVCALTLSVAYAAFLDRYVDSHFRRYRSQFRGESHALSPIPRGSA